MVVMAKAPLQHHKKNAIEEALRQVPPVAHYDTKATVMHGLLPMLIGFQEILNNQDENYIIETESKKITVTHQTQDMTLRY